MQTNSDISLFFISYDPLNLSFILIIVEIFLKTCIVIENLFVYNILFFFLFKQA
ncbi:hypothetical protein SC10_B2orf05000 [Bacillus paralicheniformis]|nr:hypothetical protein SC10_B2orf05000 [Bacillus paralicheniformis]